MSDRNAKADSSGDLHEIKVLQAEIERLRNENEAWRRNQEWLNEKDKEIERLQKRNALLEDVAVAADKWRRSDDPGHSSACSEDAFCEVSYAYCESCKLRDALDKLREVGDGC